MTTADLKELLDSEMNRVYTWRAYRNSQDVRVMLIDMTYDDDVPRCVTFINENAPVLTTEVIHATPFGSTPRRRIVVTGFAN